jgi:hypothetical protein
LRCSGEVTASQSKAEPAIDAYSPISRKLETNFIDSAQRDSIRLPACSREAVAARAILTVVLLLFHAAIFADDQLELLARAGVESVFRGVFRTPLEISAEILEEAMHILRTDPRIFHRDRGPQAGAVRGDTVRHEDLPLGSNSV